MFCDYCGCEIMAEYLRSEEAAPDPVARAVFMARNG
jgi:hypothetical protein